MSTQVNYLILLVFLCNTTRTMEGFPAKLSQVGICLYGTVSYEEFSPELRIFAHEYGIKQFILEICIAKGEASGDKKGTQIYNLKKITKRVGEYAQELEPFQIHYDNGRIQSNGEIKSIRTNLAQKLRKLGTTNLLESLPIDIIPLDKNSCWLTRKALDQISDNILTLSMECTITHLVLVKYNKNLCRSTWYPFKNDTSRNKSLPKSLKREFSEEEKGEKGNEKRARSNSPKNIVLKNNN